MTKRQEKLLKAIISEYIKTAHPVGSESISEKLSEKVSSATIRNEMALLTEQGYLLQPHTSAGRIPRAKGFSYYIKHLLLKKTLSPAEKKLFKQIRRIDIKEEVLMKHIAQQAAVFSQELSIIAFDTDTFYYTGLSYLFNQPEFQDQELVYNISYIVDHLDRIMAEIFDSVGEETEVLIGRKNPFGKACSAILTRLRLPLRRKHNVIGLLGPVRMNYTKNLAVINYIKEMLSQ